MSLALYVQCAVFTQGAFLLLVLFLLVVGFCINSKEGDFKKMIATPMYMLFPMHFSKFGLSAGQQNRVKFYASSVALRLLCCAAFWAVFWTQSAGVKQMVASGCPRLAAWVFDVVEPENTEEVDWVRGDCSRMPAFLRDACNTNHERARTDGFSFSPQKYVMCLQHRSPLLGNLCVTEACSCQVLWDMYEWVNVAHEQVQSNYNFQETMQVWVHVAQGWETSLMALLYLPSVSLVFWLFCSLLLPQLLGLAQYFSCYDGAFWMLGTAQQNPIMRDKIHHQSKQLAPQIARKKVKASCKQHLLLHLEFFLLLLDVVSDVNCLVQLLRSKQYEVAMIQACAIVLPILVDCYRSRGRSFQMVEVVRGFMASRKVGFHTDDYILALQAEKGLEAPLSFMIQYYTVFRLTSIVSFFSVLCSIPLSIYSMSKFVYVQFEFCLIEAIEKKTEELNEEVNSAADHASNTKMAAMGNPGLIQLDPPGQPTFQGFLPQSFGRPKVLDTE